MSDRRSSRALSAALPTGVAVKNACGLHDTWLRLSEIGAAHHIENIRSNPTGTCNGADFFVGILLENVHESFIKSTSMHIHITVHEWLIIVYTDTLTSPDFCD